MNTPAEETAVADFVAAMVAEAPPLTVRQLDRLQPLLHGPQAETQAAA